MFQDSIKKMNTELKDLVEYKLDINNSIHYMNDYLGKHICIHWHGKVICNCGKILNKFFRSGFCYKCYWESPLASQSIFKPELCTAHLGIEERDLKWEKNFQIAPHYVYLANSSGLKVGITRSSQGIVRWMDQGASQAILLAEVPNRRFSGDIEVILKSFVADKTNWRKMLSSEPSFIDMVHAKLELLKHLPDHLQQYIIKTNDVIQIKYPVIKYPVKIKSVRLDKQSKIEGKLMGIKGQYFILDNDRVFNVRAHEGYLIDFSCNQEANNFKLF